MDHYEKYIINDDLGYASIWVGSEPLERSLKYYGYDDISEVESGSDMRMVKDKMKDYKDEILLMAWTAKEKGRGFGRQVIIKLFELGKKYKINKFKINLPSRDAQDILSHYVEIGNLEPIEDSKTGLSVAQYYTEYKFIRMPKNIIKEWSNEETSKLTTNSSKIVIKTHANLKNTFNLFKVLLKNNNIQLFIENSRKFNFFLQPISQKDHLGIDIFLSKFVKQIAEFDPYKKSITLDVPLTAYSCMSQLDDLIKSPKTLIGNVLTDPLKDRIESCLEVIEVFILDFSRNSKYLQAISHELVHAKQTKEGRNSGTLNKSETDLGSTDEREIEALVKELEQKMLKNPDSWFKLYGDKRTLRNFIAYAMQNIHEKTFRDLNTKRKVRYLSNIYYNYYNS